MAFRPTFTAIAAALALALAVPAAAQETYQVVGRIEKLDREGRIHVGGYRILVNDNSEVLDHHNRRASARELVVGVEVDVTCQETAVGTHAQRVIATMIR